MNKRQENKLSMYTGIVALLEREQGITASLAPMAGPIAEFKSTVNEINAMHQQRSVVRAGKTQKKSQARKALIGAMMPMTTALNIMAKMTDNAELQTISALRKSKLEKMRDTLLVNQAGIIHSQAVQYLPDLAAYRVTETMTKDLADKQAAFKQTLGEQETSMARKTSATGSLAELFGEADDLLVEKLDFFMTLFKDDQAAFYGEYKAARVIKDI